MFNLLNEGVERKTLVRFNKCIFHLLCCFVGLFWWFVFIFREQENKLIWKRIIKKNINNTYWNNYISLRVFLHVLCLLHTFDMSERKSQYSTLLNRNWKWNVWNELKFELDPSLFHTSSISFTQICIFSMFFIFDFIYKHALQFFLLIFLLQKDVYKMIRQF